MTVTSVMSGRGWLAGLGCGLLAAAAAAAAWDASVMLMWVRLGMATWDLPFAPLVLGLCGSGTKVGALLLARVMLSVPWLFPGGPVGQG